MLPESFVNRMKEMLGEEYEAFSEALKEERHQALRVNPLKAEPEDFARTRGLFPDAGSLGENRFLL